MRERVVWVNYPQPQLQTSTHNSITLRNIHLRPTKSAAGLTYTPWLKDLGLNDVFMATASGYTQFGDEREQAVSASMRYFSLGNIQFTDNMVMI
jgi:hypothetical protein